MLKVDIIYEDSYENARIYNLCDKVLWCLSIILKLSREL